MGLLTPVEVPHGGSWVTARGTDLVLPVESTAVASSAQSVRLGVALSERGGTLYVCARDSVKCDICRRVGW